jgi:hypothetical protein
MLKMLTEPMAATPGKNRSATNLDQSPAAANNGGLVFSIKSIAQRAAIGVGIAAAGSIFLDAGHSNALVYRETLTSKTFTGFNFGALGVDPATIAGPGAILRKVSVNATLNASVSNTYADDLTFYLDIPPLGTAGRLQIGGYSSLSATTRLSWPNGGSDAPGTTVTGSFLESAWNPGGTTPIDLYTYFSAGNGIWFGNGYGASGTSGTWTGYLEIDYDPVNPPSTAVPAPLPLAGAAASFAWARTLRRRIQEGSKR